MTRKSLMAVVAAAALALSLGACSTDEPNSGGSADAPKDSETSEGSADGPKNGETYVFGNIAYNMQDIWNVYSVEAFEYAADELGVEVVALDAENSLENSVSLMEDLIARDVDGISVFPISPDQAATLGRMANDAGIPITFENTQVALEEDEYVALVAAEYGVIGAAAMDYIADKYPGAKVLFVAGAKGGGVYETYQEGIDEKLEELDGAIEIVSTVHGDWETEPSMNVTADAIQAGTEFDVVFANNEQMGKGVRNALDEAGIDVPVISTGGGPDGLEMIGTGELTATMSAPVSLQGLITFRNLFQHVTGSGTPDKFTSLPVIPVDADNMDEAVSWEVDDTAVEFIGGLK